jgi:hypothetical protein
VATTVGACSNARNLTGQPWQLVAISEKVPAFQGVIPPADQGKYTIQFLTGAHGSARPTATASPAYETPARAA